MWYGNVFFLIPDATVSTTRHHAIRTAAEQMLDNTQNQYVMRPATAQEVSQVWTPDKHM